MKVRRLVSGWRDALAHRSRLAGAAERAQARAPGLTTTVAPGDQMIDRSKPDGYFVAGEDALRAVQRGLAAAGVAEPARVLDLPCGHGRVLRYLQAAWPEAHLAAAELDPDGVEFCAATFGAEPILSREPVWEADIGGGYDLIWSGSLFTHFPADAWAPTLRLYAGALAPQGVLVFSTHGARPLGFLRGDPEAVAYLGPWLHDRYGLSDDAAESIVSSVDLCGFGYAPYRGAVTRADGVSVSLPGWVEDRLADAGLARVLFEDGGWGGHQDIWAVRPGPEI